MDEQAYWRAKLKAATYTPASSGLGRDAVLYRRYEGADRPAAWKAETSNAKDSALSPLWSRTKDFILTHPLGAGKTPEISVSREQSSTDDTAVENATSDPFLQNASTEEDEIDLEQLKQRHFQVWRGLPSNQDQHLVLNQIKIPPPLIDRIPVDARCPDHALTDERRLAGALAFVPSDVELSNPEKPIEHTRQPCLFMFALEPVQAFIAESRSSRDFWTSSMLIAELGFAAMTALIKRYGPDAIISPDLRGNPRADQWFQSKKAGGFKIPENTDVSTYAGLVPNVLFAIVPRGDTANTKGPFPRLEDLAKACYEAAKHRWNDCVEVVANHLRSKFGQNSREPPAESLWTTQTEFESLFGAHWTALPWEAPLPPSENIQNYEEYGKMFAGRATTNQDLPPDLKRVQWSQAPGEQRPLQHTERARKDRFAPFVSEEILSHSIEQSRKVFVLTDPQTVLRSHGFDYGLLQHELRARNRLEKNQIERKQEPQVGEKCTLCGHRSALSGLGASKDPKHPPSRQAIREIWHQVDPDHWGKERLCSVCCVKRYLVEADKSGEVFNHIWGYKEDKKNPPRVPFPSTAAVAMQRYLVDLLACEETQRSLGKFVDELESDPSISKTAFALSLPRLAQLTTRNGSAKDHELAQRLLPYDAQLLLPETWQSEAALADRFRNMQKDDASDVKRRKEQAEKLADLAAKVQSSFEKQKAGALSREQTLESFNQKGDVRPNKKIAMIAMDGDSMGQLLLGDPKQVATTWRDVLHPDWVDHMEGTASEDYASTGWKRLLGQERLTGPALHAFISRALGYFAHRIVPWVVECEFAGRLIYAGGDDVVALAPADDALKIAARLQQFYAAAWVIDTQAHRAAWGWRQSNDAEPIVLGDKAQHRFVILNHATERIEWNKLQPAHTQVPIGMRPSDWHPDLSSATLAESQLLALLGPAQSMSAGIVYGHYKTPMRTMQKESHRLLDERAKAKGYGERSSVALSHRSRGGAKSEVVLKWNWSEIDKDTDSKTWTAYEVMDHVQKGLRLGCIPSRLGYKLREEFRRFGPFLCPEGIDSEKVDTWQQDLIRSLLLNQADGANLHTKLDPNDRKSRTYLDVLTQALLEDKMLMKNGSIRQSQGEAAIDTVPAIGTLDLARYLNSTGSDEEAEEDA